MIAVPLGAAWWFGAIMTVKDFGAAVGGAAMVISLLLAVATVSTVIRGAGP